MKRVGNKISFMKSMTSVDRSPEKTLFKFDKLYDYCLKNIHKCINLYEKDLSKEKDGKYYELKAEGEILSKELKLMRN
jgi:hypothetical protein